MSENITSGKVKVRIRYQFAPVPRELAQNPKVTARTLGVITYLCSKGEDWIPRVYDICKRFNLGQKAWAAVSKEMRQLNVLGDIKTRNGTELIFDPNGIEVIHNPPLPFGTLPKGTLAKSKGIDHIDPRSERSCIKDHNHNDSNDFKKRTSKQETEAATPKKPSMKERMRQLDSNQLYTLQKLLDFKSIFMAVALSILEQNTIGEIESVIEAAKREEVVNAGKYIVKCLYKKQM